MVHAYLFVKVNLEYRRQRRDLFGFRVKLHLAFTIPVMLLC